MAEQVIEGTVLLFENFDVPCSMRQAGQTADTQQYHNILLELTDAAFLGGSGGGAGLAVQI